MAKINKVNSYHRVEIEMPDRPLKYAVFNTNGAAVAVGNSREDCLRQIIENHTPDSLLEMEWEFDWIKRGYRIREIDPILAKSEKLPQYDWSSTFGSRLVLKDCFLIILATVVILGIVTLFMTYAV